MKSIEFEGLHIDVSSNNIHIVDSYTIKKRKTMRHVLGDLKESLELKHIVSPFDERSIKSMVNEWVTHNNLFWLGYKRERTGSVDLNCPQKWYMPILYWLFSRVTL